MHLLSFKSCFCELLLHAQLDTVTESPLTRMNPPTCDMQPAIPAARQTHPNTHMQTLTQTMSLSASCRRIASSLASNALSSGPRRQRYLTSLAHTLQSESTSWHETNRAKYAVARLRLAVPLSPSFNATRETMPRVKQPRTRPYVTSIDVLNKYRSCIATHHIDHISCGPLVTRTLEAGPGSSPVVNHTDTSAHINTE